MKAALRKVNIDRRHLPLLKSIDSLPRFDERSSSLRPTFSFDRYLVTKYALNFVGKLKSYRTFIFRYDDVIVTVMLCEEYYFARLA